MRREGCIRLFETKSAKGRLLHKLLVCSIFVGICSILSYRLIHFLDPEEGAIGTWGCVLMFTAELWFSFYWFLAQFCRWDMVYHSTFKDRLSLRYEECLPGVDVFVCTADPRIEPPLMVINTVLSVMGYDYPTEKLSIYLSDDGVSELTFYAMLEASHYAKYWLPFCKKFKIEPRSPEAYFKTRASPSIEIDDPLLSQEWSSIKKLYEDVKDRIDTATKLGQIPRKDPIVFLDWDLSCSQHDHPTILQILIDAGDRKAFDIDGQPLPTLVYLAREKRPQYHHNFKAGALNALIRVSSEITNGTIILNVDCDMYSNNAESVRDALCFFMDEEKGPDIAYVQYPMHYENLSKNDIYGSMMRVANKVELAGFDANGGPCYIGSGCFQRRETLCGLNYSKEWQTRLRRKNDKKERSTRVLEEMCKVLASCTYEENTQWGKDIGLKYDCTSEDVITGLSIQCRGWKSMNLSPERKAFVGVSPTTLLQSLVQHKRWSEGLLQIFFSKYCPLIYGYKKITLKLQFSYCPYMLWALNCLATLCYVSVPSLCLLRGISVFPKVSSPWFLSFMYVIIAENGYSLGEFLWCGGTSQGWWNEQRMWLFRRTTSYFFALWDTILKLIGLSESDFIVTAKLTDEDVYQRYQQEVMEFGTPSPFFTIIATQALLNLFSFLWVVKGMLITPQLRVLEPLIIQIIICFVVVLVNLPVYEALFFRKDKGRMAASVTYKSVILAVLICTITLY